MNLDTDFTSHPPFYKPLYYVKRAEEERHRKAQLTAKSDWRNQAIFQGLVALGFLALGRHSFDKGWALGVYISMGSMQAAIQKHTQALSNYLSLRKQQHLDSLDM